MADASLKTCPSCKQDALVRIIDGGAGMMFKGSGFYITDYKKSGGDGEAKKKKKTQTVEVKSESTDKKPATTETKSSDLSATSDKKSSQKE